MLPFKDCTLDQLDEMFGLKPLPLKQMPVLQAWLNGKNEISEQERGYVSLLREYLQEHAEDWNEQELSMHFIGPMFALVKFDYERRFSLFAQRPLNGAVEGTEMGGRPDGLIATGYRRPQKPYFCFQEYKKEKDPEGDPQAQVLAAMLVAQEINEHRFPVYGCYVRGRLWFFMALRGKEYAVSQGHLATREDIFDIFRILKVLKQMIIERVSNDATEG
ncbi:hypothetical protein QUF80_16560 [Desulfococcaceae bacterium HSG8]|nr:hypothetical protein [Desulfococcaceae bacterium HSG8]